MVVDGSAFGEALAQHRPYLRVLVRLSLGERFRGKIDESGIVQETLLAACEAQDGPCACRSDDLLPWLRRILSNTLAGRLRALRAAKRRGDLEVSLEATVQQSSDRLDRFLADSAPSPGARLAGDERRLLLASALCNLPERQLQAVILHHLEGAPVRDVARKLEATEAAVTGLLCRGLEQLRDELRLREDP